MLNCILFSHWGIMYVGVVQNKHPHTQSRLTPTSDTQAEPELLQGQASVAVPVTVLDAPLGTASQLQPSPQEATKRASLVFAQHPAGVHVQLEEVPPQRRLWSGGLFRIQEHTRRGNGVHGCGGGGAGGGRGGAWAGGGGGGTGGDKGGAGGWVGAWV